MPHFLTTKGRFIEFIGATAGDSGVAVGVADGVAVGISNGADGVGVGVKVGEPLHQFTTLELQAVTGSSTCSLLTLRQISNSLPSAMLLHRRTSRKSTTVSLGSTVPTFQVTTPST